MQCRTQAPHLLCPPASSLQVRSAATAALQRAIISGERAALLPLAIHQCLAAFVLPLLQHLCRNVGSKQLPSADVTVREVVRLLAKALLLFLPALQQQTAFGALWRAILDAMQVGPISPWQLVMRQDASQLCLLV
jgi:hypothetical protein